MLSVFNEHHGEIHVAGVKQKRGSNDRRRSQREKWGQILRSLAADTQNFCFDSDGDGTILEDSRQRKDVVCPTFEQNPFSCCTGIGLSGMKTETSRVAM